MAPSTGTWDTEAFNNNHLFHYTTKVHTVEAMVFPVVMYRCDSWTIKKAERASTAGGAGSIPGGGTKILKSSSLATKK